MKRSVDDLLRWQSCKDDRVNFLRNYLQQKEDKFFTLC